MSETKNEDKKILVTAALPYANGHIHIGHLVEYIQTDIWVRFQKLNGRRCIFICADDTHGTAIMIRARQEGRSERELIAEMQAAHEKDFAGFGIEFDHYGSTNSQENYQLCSEIWGKLRSAGLIREDDVEQLYDPQVGTFLADRFVKGTCPECKSPGEYGDNCSKCSATYSPTDLIDPVSTLSGATPVKKTAKHLFVQIEQLRGFLTQWTQSGKHLQTEIANYLKGHFLGHELRDWDVSRPEPYFGFAIPDSPGNYWYVWFDAPIGYIASTWQWCKLNNQKLSDWWQSDRTEIHHFIGKDITYFHTLFWPGVLKASGYALPSFVHIHGFLTVDKEKMAKSRGTMIRASKYLELLDPSYLRYYYASKLGPRPEDIDLNFQEFIAKVDSDLVGKVVNLASRTARFVEGTGLSIEYPHDGGLFAAGVVAGDRIAEAYEQGDYARAMRLIMELADAANSFVENTAPWTLKKDPALQVRLQEVCTIVLNLFRQLCVYLAPVLPKLSQQCGRLLQQEIVAWSDSKTPLVGTQVSKFEHLMQRVDPKKVEQMVDESKEVPKSEVPSVPAQPVTVAAVASPASDQAIEPLVAEPLAPTCTIEDFAKVDLRVARVIKAEEVPEAKKLVKLTVSLGGDVTRTVFAGIKAAYTLEQLEGRLVVIVANLQPRQMKFGLSEGMVTAAGAGGTEVFLLGVDTGAKPGHRVH
ncbi:MAG: methionine--tRNA ligase [Planctomycetaceae bacterium]|jgi:methionyl-tRNA synthetase|nr:methionine--tRNA ligase [Planctomycetaceae bacterium]